MKGLIGLYEIPGCSGNCTNKLRVERLLQHLHYSPDLIQEILAKFPKKEEDLGNDGDEMCDEMQVDNQCEAEMLAKILEGMEKHPDSSTEPPSKKPRHDKKDERKPVNHGEFVRLMDKPDLSSEQVPPGCTLKIHQGNSNPYVQGMLPPSMKWKGYNSHSRSFSSSGAASSSDSNVGKRTVLGEQAARTQVLAWLWDWWNHQK